MPFPRDFRIGHPSKEFLWNIFYLVNLPILKAALSFVAASHVVCVPPFFLPVCSDQSPKHLYTFVVESSELWVRDFCGDTTYGAPILEGRTGHSLSSFLLLSYSVVARY